MNQNKLMVKHGLVKMLNNQIYLEYGEILYHLKIEEHKQMIMLKYIWEYFQELHILLQQIQLLHKYKYGYH